jgi:hypothetical protein
MTRLSNLLQHSSALSELLMSLPSGSWNRSTIPGTPGSAVTVDVDSRTILARWTIDVLDTLIVVLDQKSKAILRPKSAMASHLFILNNLSEVEKRVRNDRTMQTVIGSVTSTEKEQAKRGSRLSSGSNALQMFSMPRSFEKVKRSGLDGQASL